MTTNTLFCPRCGAKISFDGPSDNNNTSAGSSETACATEKFRFCTRCGVKVSSEGKILSDFPLEPWQPSGTNIKVKFISSTKNKGPIEIIVINGPCISLDPGSCGFIEFIDDGIPRDIRVRSPSKPYGNNIKFIPARGVDVEIEYIRSFIASGFTIHEKKSPR